MKTLQLEDTEALLLAVALREYLQQSDRFGRDTPSDNLAQHPTARAIIEKLIERIAAEPKPDAICAYCQHGRKVHTHETSGAKCTMAGCACQGFGDE